MIISKRKGLLILCFAALTSCAQESDDEVTSAAGGLSGDKTADVNDADGDGIALGSHASVGYWFTQGSNYRSGAVICKRPSAYTSYRLGAVTNPHNGTTPSGTFTMPSGTTYSTSSYVTMFNTDLFVKLTAASAPTSQTVLPVVATPGVGTAGTLYDARSEYYTPDLAVYAATTIYSTSSDCDTSATGTQDWIRTSPTGRKIYRDGDDGGNPWISGGALAGVKDGENSAGDGDDLTCISRFTSANVATIESNCRSWCNAPCGVADAKVVFVTATSYTGNLGGLSGANTICQNAATANGLSGTFKAWLSDSTTGPGTTISHASIPYVRRDGVLVANNWADLTDGTLAAPINVTESGGVSAATFAWTNTNTDGTVNSSFSNCSDWGTSSSALFGWGGYPQDATSSWTDPVDKFKCNEAYPIYCIQN